jgi:hypothetical protein
MVHRTDFAGSVGCSIGSQSPAMTVYAAVNLTAPSQVSFQKPLPNFYPGGKKCSRLFVTAVPSVPAIYVETLGPMKR